MHQDKAIINGLKSGKKRNEAFSMLVSTYHQRLYWHVRKIVMDHDDADDVLQNTFIKIWNGIDGFREESGLFTWLYRIATNEALTFLSQKRKKLAATTTENGEYLTFNLRTDPYFDGNEVQLMLQEAIASLPEKQRIVFNMKYFDDLKYEEISKILNTSVGALKASYHHAVKKIEEYVKQEVL